MKKSKKPKKIRSIKHQITFTFIGLLFLSILTISMINGAFLEKYFQAGWTIKAVSVCYVPVHPRKLFQRIFAA